MHNNIMQCILKHQTSGLLKLQCLKILMNLQKYQPNQAVHRLVFMWFQLSFKKHIIPVFVLLSTKTDLGRLA